MPKLADKRSPYWSVDVNERLEYLMAMMESVKIDLLQVETHSQPREADGEIPSAVLSERANESDSEELGEWTTRRTKTKR